MPETVLPILLSLASHELRGPTGVVRGYLRLFEQDATLGDRPRRVITEMTRATDRLAALLDELGDGGMDGDRRRAFHPTSYPVDPAREY